MAELIGNVTIKKLGNGEVIKKMVVTTAGVPRILDTDVLVEKAGADNEFDYAVIKPWLNTHEADEHLANTTDDFALYLKQEKSSGNLLEDAVDFTERYPDMDMTKATPQLTPEGEEPMKTFRVKASIVKSRLKAVLNREDRWDTATVAIGQMLGVSDFSKLADETSRLIIPEEEVNKVEGGMRNFKKVAYGMYTPKKSTKLGKKWIAEFQQIVEANRLNTETFTSILFELRMVNRSFHMGYKNLRCFELNDEIYMSWRGDGTAPENSFVELSVEEAEEIHRKLEQDSANSEKKVCIA